MQPSCSGQLLFVLSALSCAIWLVAMSVHISAGGVIHGFLAVGVACFVGGLYSGEGPPRGPEEPKAQDQRRCSGLLRRE